MMIQKIVSILLFAFILQGCQITNYATDIKKYNNNRTNLGLVVLSTTVNTGEIPQINSITLEQQDSNKTYVKHVLSNKIPGKSDNTSLFFGGLPAGEYKIVEIRAITALGSSYLPLKDSDLIGNFVITPNETTDLGRLILSAIGINNKVFFGRSKLVVKNTELIHKFFNNEPELTKPETLLGWLTNHNPKDVVEEYAISHPQGISSLSETSSGDIIAGAKMGTVLIRSKDKKWKILSKNQNLNRITAIFPHKIQNNLAIAADEFGSLYYIQKNGNYTLINKGNLPDEKIIFISSSENHDTWFIGVAKNGYAELYKSNSLSNGNWTIEKTTSIGTDFWLGITNAWYWQRSNGIGYISTIDKSISCFNYNTNKWTTSPIPNDRYVFNVATSQANDAVGVLTSPGGGVAGVFATTYLTNNCGNTWLETDSPYTAKHSAPLLLKENFIIETGGRFRDTGIYASDDNAKSWSKISNRNFLANRLWMTKYNGLFAISIGRHGFETIQNSTDLGATWAIEDTSIITSLE